MGLGVVASGARRITDAMMQAATAEVNCGVVEVLDDMRRKSRGHVKWVTGSSDESGTRCRQRISHTRLVDGEPAKHRHTVGSVDCGCTGERAAAGVGSDRDADRVCCRRRGVAECVLKRDGDVDWRTAARARGLLAQVSGETISNFAGAAGAARRTSHARGTSGEGLGNLDVCGFRAQPEYRDQQTPRSAGRPITEPALHRDGSSPWLSLYCTLHHFPSA